MLREGDLVRLRGAFTNAGDLPADPTVVTVRYRPPGGAIVQKVYGADPEVVRESAGIYHIDVPITVGGTWTYRWIGTGAVQTADETSFAAMAATI